MSVHQATKSSKIELAPAVTFLVALVLTVLLALSFTRLWDGDPSLKSQVKLHILNHQNTETDRLASETMFGVAFEAPGLQYQAGRDLNTGLEVELRQDGQPLMLLISNESGETGIQPLDVPREDIVVPGVAISVPGRLEYRLPRLETGEYELCMGFALWTEPISEGRRRVSPSERGSEPSAGSRDKPVMLDEAEICKPIEVT